MKEIGGIIGLVCPTLVWLLAWEHPHEAYPYKDTWGSVTLIMTDGTL